MWHFRKFATKTRSLDFCANWKNPLELHVVEQWIKNATNRKLFVVNRLIGVSKCIVSVIYLSGKKEQAQFSIQGWNLNFEKLISNVTLKILFLVFIIKRGTVVIYNNTSLCLYITTKLNIFITFYQWRLVKVRDDLTLHKPVSLTNIQSELLLIISI